MAGFVLVGNVSGTTFHDAGLVAEESYFYRVTAVNERGESYGHSNTYKKN